MNTNIIYLMMDKSEKVSVWNSLCDAYKAAFGRKMFMPTKHGETYDEATVGWAVPFTSLSSARQTTVLCHLGECIFKSDIQAAGLSINYVKQ